MKKIIAVILMIAVALSLSACGKKKEGDLGKQTTIDEKNGYTLVRKFFRSNSIRMKKNSKKIRMPK